MTELEMYELWCTLRLWANYNQLNQTIEKTGLVIRSTAISLIY